MDDAVSVPLEVTLPAHSKDFLAFNPQLTCDEPWLDRLIEEVVIEFRALPNAAKVKDDHQRCLRPILANLIKAAKANSPLGISRDKNYYKLPRKYNPAALTYNRAIFCLDHLERAGLITVKKGSYNRATGRGYRTRVMASDKLLDLFGRFSPVSGPAICLDPRAERIRIKDRDKRLIDYKDDTRTKKMRKRLDDINQAIASAKIELPGADYIADREKTLYRVFNNGSFGQGGRFYGAWWQDVPEEQREKILINDEPTVERDFSGMHVKMLYAEEAGIDYQEDPYVLAEFGVQSRNAFKKVLLICLSAKSRRGALAAVQDDRRNTPSRYPHNFVAKEALDAFLKKHQRIAHVFFNPQLSLRLQYLDSQIAERIMLELNRQGIVALPIHDSFIVAKDHDELLKGTMERIFEEELGVRPTIKLCMALEGNCTKLT
jgi:hypothetical protein